MELYVDIKKRLPGFLLDVKFEGGADALGLLGASGSGKSMTLRCIAGLEKPDEGRIVLNGKVLFDSEKGINIPCRNRKIGYLFQNYALFPNMTVEENIGFALGGIDKKQRNLIVQEKIEMVKLTGLEKRYPSQLSGGQQQRVALARALAIEPEALLLDEPFSALDDHLRTQMVKQLIETLSDYHGVTLFVTHNMEEAYRVCSNLVILMGGKVEAQGDKENLFESPPTIATAQLTGCKNYSAAKILQSGELDVVDWGIKIKTKDLPINLIKHVAMRAHNIRLASEKDKDNVFKCWPCFTNEAPFRIMVYLTLGKKPTGSDDYQLLWDISKEEWFELQKTPIPWNIYINSEKLIYLEK